jgi:hypothetical protein
MEKGFITSLIVLFFVITSCTDNNKVAEENFEPDLTGSWNRTDDQAEGNIVSTYTFKSNSSYIYRIDWFGFNGEPKTELTSSSESTGVFKVEGDSLFFQNLNYGSGLNSKFWIEGNVLHLEYISYPADAPVLTQMKYNRID